MLALSIQCTSTGQDVEYEAVSEEIPLPDENGGTDATLFMTSYLRLNAEKTGRPILFAFNGGPGSASVFLHLGGLRSADY